MSLPHSWKKGPPILRALAAQAAAFLVLLALAWTLALRLPFWTWPLLQGGLAALLSRAWGLGGGWCLFQAALPFALAWQLGHRVPSWIYPAALAALLLVFGGGIWTRVPLYNSSHAAWQALLTLVPPDRALSMVDLGAGLGGPLAFLARKRPRARFTGIEASPLVWLLAWLRTLPVRANCRIRPGSFWSYPLEDCQIVYAFLSPVPMADLWAKACREMPPGSLLVSNTFAVPGVTPSRVIPLPDRRDSRLLLYAIGPASGGDSQEKAE